MKLKAYSLLEIIVALFLSGIVISAVYSGYVFTHQQFFKFTTIKTEIRNYFELLEVLNREFETSKKVIKKGDREIEVEMIDRVTKIVPWFWILSYVDNNSIVQSFSLKTTVNEIITIMKKVY